MTERTDQTIILLHDVNETETLGRLLGAAAEAGDVLCLDGDLGAGKTTLTQAIARGLEVPAACYVTSPSFAVFQEYPGRLPLYHMDFYRLRGEDDVLDLGLEEYLWLRVDGHRVVAACTWHPPRGAPHFADRWLRRGGAAGGGRWR